MSPTESSLIDSRRGWAVAVAGGLAGGIGMGMLQAIAVFLAPISLEFGWTRGQTSLAFTAGYIAMGLGAIPLGHLSDRIGARPVVAGCVVVTALASLLLSRLGSLTELYLFYLLMGGLGSAGIIGPSIATIGSWFERRKGLAIGTALALQGIGIAGITQLAGVLQVQTGWRSAYLVLAVLALGVGVPMALLLRRPPAESPAATASPGAPPGRAGMCPIAWLAAATLFTLIMQGMVRLHLPAHAADAGMSPEQAAGVLTVFFGVGSVSRIYFGRMVDAIGALRAWEIALVLVGLMVCGLSVAHTLTQFYVLGLLLALVNGLPTAMFTSVREYIPRARQGLAMGITQLFAYVAWGIGGYVAGALFDRTGGYTLPYLVGVGFGALALMVLTALELRQRRSQARGA